MKKVTISKMPTEVLISSIQSQEQLVNEIGNKDVSKYAKRERNYLKLLRDEFFKRERCN